jgi:hypothetical protein
LMADEGTEVAFGTFGVKANGMYARTIN